jgi:hypothetical protein
MADSYIQVPPDSTGKKADARQIVIGANTVQRQRMEWGITAPLLTYVTSASLAAGSTATLDSTQLTSAMTGRLWGVSVACATSFKAEVFTVANGTPSTTKGIGISHVGHWNFTVPNPGFITVPYSVTAGLDGFRVIVTNLDVSEASDCYCVFYYDEELT